MIMMVEMMLMMMMMVMAVRSAAPNSIGDRIIYTTGLRCLWASRVSSINELERLIDFLVFY